MIECRRCGYRSDSVEAFAWMCSWERVDGMNEGYDPELNEPMILLSCKRCWIADVDLADDLMQQLMIDQDEESPIAYGQYPVIKSPIHGRLFHN